MTTPRGERVKKVNAMAPRERRRWMNQIIQAQEEVDKAIETLHRTMLKGYDAGLPLSAIGGALGLHSTSVQERIKSVRKASAGADSE